MSEASERSAKERTPQEIAELLHRILGAIENDQRQRWMEITGAIVLALTTVASAWCAYQATL